MGRARISRAASFAIGFHIAGWLTVTALGAFYAARLNIRLRDLTRTEEPVEAGDPLPADARA